LEAKVEIVDDVYSVELVGRIGFDVIDSFRKVCMEKLSRRKLIFNLESLHFVGSHGIADFVSTLEDLSHVDETRIKFCGVSSEFKKIFQASAIRNLEFFDGVDRAVLSFKEVPQVII
jgi:anti-anti-sigma factor